MRTTSLHAEEIADEHGDVCRWLGHGRDLRLGVRPSRPERKPHPRRSTLIADVRSLLNPPPAPVAERRLSRDEFERCAVNDPIRLETLLRSGLEGPLLTFAAEAVALVVEPQPSLLAALAQLLRHEKTYVREGACYGARPHLRSPMLHAELARIAAEDVSETLREIAQEILDETAP